MARIYTPTSGVLSVRGNVAPLIEMGAGFNPELSGTDNILLNGAMLGIHPPRDAGQGRRASTSSPACASSPSSP